MCRGNVDAAIGKTDLLPTKIIAIAAGTRVIYAGPSNQGGIHIETLHTGMTGVAHVVDERLDRGVWFTGA